MKLKVLVADDESVARKRLTRLLSAVPDVELVGECSSGEEVLARLEDVDVDVLLLDIQMPGLSGLETKALLADGGPYVIFATAHPEHALEAFDVGAVDYVLKPIEAGRLMKALERAAERLGPRQVAGAPARLPVTTTKGVRLVDPAEITHALFDGQLVTIHLASGETILADTSLQELARKLPEDRFVRVHRRALLNLLQVERLEPVATGGYLAWTRSGERIEVARQAARRLRRHLGL